MKNYRLYVKFPNDKTFKPVDWKSGRQVVNLIYASIFTELEKELVEQDLINTTKQNAGMQWKFKVVE